jgi:hypothetical protein
MPHVSVGLWVRNTPVERLVPSLGGVRRAMTDPSARRWLIDAIALADRYDVQVIAEGVERRPQIPGDPPYGLPMSPNLNAYADRFVRSIKEECLNRMIFV